jgi:AAA15 family ATPase/GTPase
MRLQRLDYIQFKGTPNEWGFENCTLGDINLVVGKNATGKTRTLNVIRSLAELISEGTPIKYSEGVYNAEFIHRKEKTYYQLEHHNYKITKENLVIGNTKMLSRNSRGVGWIYAAKLKQDIEFKIQTNLVAAINKYDSIQHPFLDKLFKWGKGLRRYDFGTTLGRDMLLMKGVSAKKEDIHENVLLRDTQKVISILLDGMKKFPSSLISAIIEDMKTIGFDLVDIGVDSVPNASIITDGVVISSPPIGIFIKEADRGERTFQIEISQGMFRALSVLIQINYSLLATESSCILIDDIGEGLDYSRSSLLVRLLIDKAKNSKVQLIMATNDRFIMNNVPLEYWIIIERQGGRCIHHNYRNSKGIFDKFEKTGLNNFDLFTSGYYLNNIKK